MPIFVALLRGINVGGHNILPMKEFVSLLDEEGLSQVKTYIQSGNAVFQAAEGSTADMESRIADRIEAAKGFRPRVFVIDAGRLTPAIEANPFRDADPSRVLFCFFESSPADTALAALEALRTSSESYHLGEHALYLHAPAGIGRSKLAGRVEKALGVPVTARNLRTVLKLRDMLDEVRSM